MIPRTDRQDACLRAIRKLTVRGVPPSIEELRIHLGMGSRSGVHGLLVELREKGLVSWTPNQARSLVVTDPEITREELARLDSETLRRVASWAHSILAERGS
ncbi:MAG: hypothetical protein AB1760_01240 [Pseudomonadota bacterium]